MGHGSFATARGAGRYRATAAVSQARARSTSDAGRPPPGGGRGARARPRGRVHRAIFFCGHRARCPPSATSRPALPRGRHVARVPPRPPPARLHVLPGLPADHDDPRCALRLDPMRDVRAAHSPRVGRTRQRVALARARLPASGRGGPVARGGRSMSLGGSPSLGIFQKIALESERCAISTTLHAPSRPLTRARARLSDPWAPQDRQGCPTLGIEGERHSWGILGPFCPSLDALSLSCRAWARAKRKGPVHGETSLPFRSVAEKNGQVTVTAQNRSG